MLWLAGIQEVNHQINTDSIIRRKYAASPTHASVVDILVYVRDRKICDIYIIFFLAN